MSDKRDEEQLADSNLREELRNAFPAAEFPGHRVEERIRASLAASPAAEGAERELNPLVGRESTGGARGSVALTPWFSAIAVAAAITIFVAGAEYGRRLGTSSGPAIGGAAGNGIAVESGNLPLDIQGTGTRYVASLARLSDVESDLSDAERRIAREVALAALYAASVELLREAGDDELLRAVAEMVAAKREAAATRAGPETF